MHLKMFATAAIFAGMTACAISSPIPTDPRDAAKPQLLDVRKSNACFTSGDQDQFARWMRNTILRSDTKDLERRLADAQQVYDAYEVTPETVYGPGCAKLMHWMREEVGDNAFMLSQVPLPDIDAPDLPRDWRDGVFLTLIDYCTPRDDVAYEISVLIGGTRAYLFKTSAEYCAWFYAKRELDTVEILRAYAPEPIVSVAQR